MIDVKLIILGALFYIFLLWFFKEMLSFIFSFVSDLVPIELRYRTEMYKRKFEVISRNINAFFWATIAAFGVWFWFIVGWLIYSEHKSNVWQPVPRTVFFSVLCISIIAFVFMYFKELRSEGVERRWI